MAWGRKDGYVSPFDSNDPDGYVNPGTAGQTGLPGQTNAEQDWNAPGAGADNGNIDAGNVPTGQGAPQVPVQPGVSSSFSSPMPQVPPVPAHGGYAQYPGMGTTNDMSANQTLAGAAFDSSVPVGAAPDGAAPVGAASSGTAIAGNASGAGAPDAASSSDSSSATPQYSAAVPPLPRQTSQPQPQAPSAHAGPAAPTPGSDASPSSSHGFTSTVPVHAPEGAPGRGGGTPFARTQQSGSASQDKSGSGVGGCFRFILVCIFIIAGIGIGNKVIDHLTGADRAPSYSSSTSDGSDSSQSEPAPRWKTQVGEGTVSLSSAAAPAKVSIDKVETGPADDYGKPTVLVTYTWTNPASENMAFMYLLSNAYQDGIGLRSVYLYRNGTEGYDRDAYSEKIGPQKSQTLKVAYDVTDPAKDVVVTVSGRSSDSDIVAATFTHNGDGSYAATGQVPNSIKDGGEAPTFMNYSIEGVPKAGIKDADGYSGKLLGSGGAVTQTSIASAVFGPGLGASDDGKDVVVITYRWRNDGERPWDFGDATQYKVYQNGAECQPTGLRYDDKVKGYEHWSQQNYVLPGATYNTTVAYKIDLSKPVDVKVKGYVNSDSVELTRTFTQGGDGTTDVAGGAGSVGGKQDPSVE